MDPNANLKEQREIAQKILRGVLLTRNELAELGLRLAELVEAQNEWLSAGGFLPDAWSRP